MFVYKFDPHMKDASDLKLTFINGKKYSEDLIEDLKPKKNKLTSQSFLLVGPRGSGKSHFMKMMYYSIKENEVLKKNYIPILFSEDLYVTSMYHFLRDGILRIFNEINDSKVFGQKADTHQQLKKLEKDFKEINKPSVKMSKSEQLIEREQQQKKYFVIIREIYIITNCKIIFIVENLQDLLGIKFAAEDLKTLRAFLIESSSPLLLIGSAVNLFDKVQKYGEPFYNFFKIRRLDGLNDDEVFELLRNECLIRNKNSKEDCIILNERIEKSKSQIKLYNVMTNGSPRLILFLYDLILENETLDVNNILSQITELTPYFKSEMDSLSGTKQMILSSICTGRPAQTVSEISSHLNEPVGIVNENVKRLVDDGMIKILEMEPNKEIKKSEKFYIVSDYYFRIWFQVRQATCREDGIRWISELAVLLFSENDLKEKIGNCTKEFKSVYESALILKQDKVYNENLLALIENNDRNNHIANEMLKLFEEENWEGIITRASKELELENYDSTFTLYFARACAYSHIDKYKEAEEDFKEIILLEANDTEKVSDILFHLSNIYFKTDRYSLAIEALNKSISINKNNVNAFARLGDIYFELKDCARGILAYDEAIKLGANDSYIYISMSLCYLKLKNFDKTYYYFEKYISSNEKYSVRDIYVFSIIKEIAPRIFNEKESVTALINQTSTLNEKVKAVIRLIILNKFNGIETIFAGILEELKVLKPQEELKQLYFCFQGETILRLNNQSPEKDFLICSRYFLNILFLLYSDENKTNEKIMEFIICYASSKDKGKINSEGLKRIFNQWEEIYGTAIPEIITALFDALENPKSRIAQVWSGDPLFNKVLKILTE